MTEPRVLIVGSGYVGGLVARRLMDEGRGSLCLRRGPEENGLPSIRADLRSGRGFDAIPSDIDQFVFSAAPDERSPSAYRELYVDGLSRLLERLPRARVVFVSSTAVYGGAEGRVDEEAVCAPEAETARILLEAEALAAGAAGGSAIVRASGIYGPGRTSLLGRLAQSPLDRTERGQLTNRIHRDDLAGFLAFIVARRDLGGIYNASDSAPSTLGEMQDWLMQRGTPEWLSSVRSAPRRGGVMNRAISNAKLLSTGFELSFPSFREGYGQLLDDQRNQ